MGKKLVAYFSASGVTAKVAEKLAEVVGAQIYEIRPEDPYTNSDLDWKNKKSRSSVEKIVPFCTSGSSGIGDTAKRMQEIVRNGVVLEGKRFLSNVSVNELKMWADSLVL